MKKIFENNNLIKLLAIVVVAIVVRRFLSAFGFACRAILTPLAAPRCEGCRLTVESSVCYEISLKRSVTKSRTVKSATTRRPI